MRTVHYIVLLSLSALSAAPAQAEDVNRLMQLEGFRAMVLAIGRINAASQVVMENPMNRNPRRELALAYQSLVPALLKLSRDFKSGKLHDADYERVMAVLGKDVIDPAKFVAFAKNPRPTRADMPKLSNSLPGTRIAPRSGASGGNSRGDGATLVYKESLPQKNSPLVRKSAEAGELADIQRNLAPAREPASAAPQSVAPAEGRNRDKEFFGLLPDGGGAVEKKGEPHAYQLLEKAGSVLSEILFPTAWASAGAPVCANGKCPGAIGQGPGPQGQQGQQGQEGQDGEGQGSCPGGCPGNGSGGGGGGGGQAGKMLETVALAAAMAFAQIVPAMINADKEEKLAGIEKDVADADRAARQESLTKTLQSNQEMAQQYVTAQKQIKDDNNALTEKLTTMQLNANSEERKDNLALQKARDAQAQENQNRLIKLQEEQAEASKKAEELQAALTLQDKALDPNYVSQGVSGSLSVTSGGIGSVAVDTSGGSSVASSSATVGASLGQVQGLVPAPSVNTISSDTTKPTEARALASAPQAASTRLLAAVRGSSVPSGHALTTTEIVQEQPALNRPYMSAAKTTGSARALAAASKPSSVAN